MWEPQMSSDRELIVNIVFTESSVEVMVPLKMRRVKMHLTFVKVQSPHVGVIWKFVDIYTSSVKNQRSKQALCKTNLTRNANDAQLDNGDGRWLIPAATHVQCFVSPVLPDRPF
ncbi:hypothetical protein TNCV_3554571 [Trichonephila clavipes]|nr:hypothetical protein TNCV_3554571 [Trichonephila clavipes]